MNIIAELTRAHRGTIPTLLARIAGSQSEHNFVTALLYEDQMHEMEMVGAFISDVKVESIPRSTFVPNKVREMTLAATKEHPSTVVFSFDAAVLALTNELNAESRLKLVFSPWGQSWNYLRGSKGLRQSGKRPYNWPSSGIGKAEALECLKKLLTEKGAYSEGKPVKKTQLRILLAAQDERFKKNHPASLMPNFITALIDAAEEDQIVCVRTTPGNADIWLANQQELPLAAALEPSATISETPLNTKPPTPATSPQLAGQGIDPQDYKTTLEKNGMGPFPNLREDLYDGLEDDAPAGHTIEKLVAKVVSTTKIKNPKAGIPWAAVRAFLNTILTRRAVLLDKNSKPITYSWLSMGSTAVGGLVENFRTLLDAELILFLLQKGAQIPFADVPKLTGVLYKTRDEENMEKLGQAIKSLTETNFAIVRDNTVMLNPTGGGGNVMAIKTAV